MAELLEASDTFSETLEFKKLDDCIKSQDCSTNLDKNEETSKTCKILGDAQDNLCQALASLIKCETQICLLQDNELKNLKISMLKQLKSAKTLLDDLIKELNNNYKIREFKPIKSVKLEENESFSRHTQKKNCDIKDELTTNIKDNSSISENKENFDHEATLNHKEEVKIEEDYLSIDESYDPYTKSKPLKRQRGRPKKVLPSPKKKSGRAEFEKPACPHCQKVYASKNGLERLELHLAKYHRTSFPCPKCNVVLSSSSELFKHKVEHNRKKERICPICGASVAAGCYSRHIRFHGEKKFNCDVCGKRFHVKHKLDDHTRTHTGEKPFECEVCGKAFTASRKLSRHRFIHTGERPHVCVLCGKGFNQKNNLKTHMKSHASGILANFDVRLVKTGEESKTE